MKKDRTSMQLRRFRVMRRGYAAYDQTFHEGVNIIRGDNGSGKSTIADFIFFALGGEYDDWKEAARQCDEVQAEIVTPSGAMTLRRSTEKRNSPVNVFFGSMADAMKSPMDGWEQYPLHRSSGGKESFSQVMFRSLLIPEAQSEGASNITMHQILRLCYSDQRTPATRLFRFENFDTQPIREAVGDLICGISGYELYDLTLQYRKLEVEYSKTSTDLSALLKSLRHDDALNTPALIKAKVSSLQSEREKLTNEIANVDRTIQAGEVTDFLKNKDIAKKVLIKVSKNLQATEDSISTTQLELREIEEFASHIEDLANQLRLAEGTYNAIGGLEFTHCPQCGELVGDDVNEGQCKLCKTESDLEKQQSRYNQLRLDFEIQGRETGQLLSEKRTSLEKLKQEKRTLKLSHQQILQDYSLKYSGGNEPREAYLAERINRIGQIDVEIKHALGKLDLAEEIKDLMEKKEEQNRHLTAKSKRMKGLREAALKRRGSALTHTGNIAAKLLQEDIAGQPEFDVADHVKIDFITDSIAVDGTLNFAESSNVFLKNSAIFALFLAAGRNKEFYHPNFLLMDNIEDKGMQETRSHHFQRMLVEHATELSHPFQLIFTTSMMNPELELDDYVIGPAYTKTNRSIDLGMPTAPLEE